MWRWGLPSVLVGSVADCALFSAQSGMLAQLAARLGARRATADGDGDGSEEGEFGPVMVDDNCSVSLPVE